MRRIQILALAAGLALAIAVMAPAQANVEVTEGSSSKTIDTACAIFQADHVVDDGGTPDDPSDDDIDHVNIYVCGDLFDDDGDGTADRASALAARYVNGGEREKYLGEVALSDVSIDVAGGTASINTTLPTVRSDGPESCTVALDFTATDAEAQSYEGGGPTASPSLGEGSSLQLTTNSSYSGTDQPATAAGTACEWSEVGGTHVGNSARISTYSQTDDHTTVAVDA